MLRVIYDNNDGRLQNHKGNNILSRGEFKGALKCFTKAIQKNPYETIYWYNRGYTYYRFKKSHECVRDLNITLRLDDENVDAICCIAHTLTDKHRYKEALVLYNKVLSMKPNEAVYYSSRAVVQFMLHNYNDSIKDCQKSINLQSGSEDPYYRLGLIYLELSEYDLAIKTLKKGLVHCTNVPFRAAINAKIGKGYALCGKLGFSRIHCMKSKELDSHESNPHMNESFAHLKLKSRELKEALFYARMSVSLDNSSVNAPRYVVLLARVLRKMKKYKQAISTARRAVKMNSYEANGLYEITMCYYETGKFAEGMKEIKDALLKDQRKYKFYRAAGMISFKLGLFSDGLKNIKHSLYLHKSFKSYKCLVINYAKNGYFSKSKNVLDTAHKNCQHRYEERLSLLKKEVKVIQKKHRNIKNKKKILVHQTL